MWEQTEPATKTLSYNLVKIVLASLFVGYGYSQYEQQARSREEHHLQEDEIIASIGIS